MKQRISLGFIIFLLILFVDGFYAFVGNVSDLEHGSTVQIELMSGNSLVQRVIDGDTIELDTGEKVRYIGVDSPETKHPVKGVECYGKISSEKNRELVEGKQVRLETDVSQTDRYGRLLRYVYLVDASAQAEVATTSAEIFVNEYLVREGFAKASSYPPDIKYQELLREAEMQARELGKGLWGEGC